MQRLSFVQGDITCEKVDAIVNAANTTLLGGGGVDGAVHRAAGPELLEACRLLQGCPTGDARITKGYRLFAKYVIHTVGPVWRGGRHGEDELLANCYRNSLILARRHHIRTIAFPSISTGAYGFPKDRACQIALKTVFEFLQNDKDMKQILLVCFSVQDLDLYNKTAHTLYSKVRQ